MHSRFLKTSVFLVLGLVSVSCVVANDPAGNDQGIVDPLAGPVTVWAGESIVFTKADGADPSSPANQDRITDSVWITRGNDGGQIFNIAERTAASKSGSPDGTLWARGTTANLEDLNFAPFRTAVGRPKNVVGENLVLFIVDEGIFIDVRFLSWSNAKSGGFSYERSTPAE
jgi:hypothetical protein